MNSKLILSFSILYASIILIGAIIIMLKNKNKKQLELNKKEEV